MQHGDVRSSGPPIWAAIMDCVVGKARQLVHRPAVQAAVQALGCSHTVSFDKGAVRWAGMTLLDLDAP